MIRGRIGCHRLARFVLVAQSRIVASHQSATRLRNKPRDDFAVSLGRCAHGRAFPATRIGFAPLAMWASISDKSHLLNEPSFTPNGIRPLSAQRKTDLESQPYFAATIRTSISIRPGGIGREVVELPCSTAAAFALVIVRLSKTSHVETSTTPVRLGKSCGDKSLKSQ